jgi:hypothetical protein
MASSYNAAFIIAHGGTVAQAAQDLINRILAAQSYLNIHTVNNPGGEIRAQLVPAPSSALDCRVLCWRAALFSLGGDGVRKSPELPAQRARVDCGSQRLSNNRNL